MFLRDDVGKNVICKKMKLERAKRDFRALLVGISEKKVIGNFFRLRGTVECKKIKKRKKF